MSPPGVCECAAWPDRHIIALGAETADLLDQFEVVVQRTPWLSLARCPVCGEHWYVAVDTVDDDYYFRRLTQPDLDGIVERGAWPADFDGFVHVWSEPADLTGAVVKHPWR